MRGICKVRNESHIIQDTLDMWSEICPDGIHIYDDFSSDDTAEICRAHPGVVEVITSNLIDPNRERAEWYNRDLLWRSAKRFLNNGDWIAYFDGDEHPYDFNPDLLDTAYVIYFDLYDVYITPEDADGPYKARRWVGPEVRQIPFMFRVSPSMGGYSVPDQRIMHHNYPEAVRGGKIKHYGKGYSVTKWEEKCDYYGHVFGPKYSEKWLARKGNAIKHDYLSDEGRPLINWSEI